MSETNKDIVDKHYIIIEHIHPLRERIIGLEKTVEYHEKELGVMKDILHDINAAIAELNSFTKRIYWSGVGVTITVVVILAFVKLIIPFIV